MESMAVPWSNLSFRRGGGNLQHGTKGPGVDPIVGADGGKEGTGCPQPLPCGEGAIENGPESDMRRRLDQRSNGTSSIFKISNFFKS